MKALLKKWNPWWVNNRVEKAKKGKKRRDKLETLKKLLLSKEIVILTGVRRSGKSTLLYQLIDSLLEGKTDPRNILYFNFDEGLYKRNFNQLENIYKTYLELNNPRSRVYVFLDEIQIVDGWEQWIKRYYDMYGEKIKFIITGSNRSMLSVNLSKLLTGRVFTETVYPLSFIEYLSFKGIKMTDFDLQRQEFLHYLSFYLKQGGFPEVVTEKDDYIKHKRLKEYYDGILFRDIIYSNNIREGAKLSELAEYCISNISSLLSYSNISKAIGINVTTTKEYLYLLENANLVFQLTFFSYSLKKSIMLQKARKVFCIDNGLRNAVSFKFSEDLGKLAENMVFVELMRRGKEVYYWKNKHEVDIVVKNQDNSLTIINVTYSDEIRDREMKGLLEFYKNFKRTGDMIIITHDKDMEYEGIKHVPLWKWLLTDKNC